MVNLAICVYLLSLQKTHQGDKKGNTRVQPTRANIRGEERFGEIFERQRPAREVVTDRAGPKISILSVSRGETGEKRAYLSPRTCLVSKASGTVEGEKPKAKG